MLINAQDNEGKIKKHDKKGSSKYIINLMQEQEEMS